LSVRGLRRRSVGRFLTIEKDGRLEGSVILRIINETPSKGARI